jgi:hypothetical protein
MSFGQKLMLQLAPKPHSKLVFTSIEYMKIKSLLDVKLVDFKFATTKDYLIGMKNDIKMNIIQLLRFTREIKMTKEVIENQKTLRQERSALLEKLKRLMIGKELVDQTI